jgi:hypothetical protein
VIQLMIRGEPSDIIKFRAFLQNMGITFEYETDISKPSKDAKWGSQKISFNPPDVSKEVLASQPSVEVTVFERRRRGTGKGKKSGNPGWVYLMETDKGVYKIGKTSNPKSRRATFGVKLPFKLEFIHLIHSSNMSALEKQLHKQFSDKRMGRSEFFALTPDDVLLIKSMKGDLD